MENKNNKAIYANVIIRLLQGPVYVDDTVWRDLLAWQSPVEEYFSKIGIKLEIAETDGFAWIKQPKAEENDDSPLPRLMKKQAISYEATLLSVILREVLEEHDVKSEGNKLYLTQKDIKERIELFYKEQTNKSKLWKELSKPITDLLKIGILKLNREDVANKDNNQYEVKRIIKAFISNERLEEIKNKLAAHVNTVQQ